MTLAHVQEITSGPGGDWAKVTCIVPLAFIEVWNAVHAELRLQLLEQGIDVRSPGVIANGQALEALSAEFLAGAPCRAAL